MKITLAITHLEDDVQIELVRKKSKLLGMRVITLCANTLSFEQWSIIQYGDKLSVCFDGKPLNIQTVWFATYPREDTLYHEKMAEYIFPGEYRSAVAQFITDLRFAVGNAKWLPGNFEKILGADSKPHMFQCAQNLGILCPDLTINSNRSNPFLRKHRPLYRKKLGFPSVVSFSRQSQNEEVVTTINTTDVKDSGCLLWQWQQPIESVAHVRSVLIEERSWSVQWRRKSPLNAIVDYRNTPDYKCVWEKTTLPAQLQLQMNCLMIKLGISICCPEFLVTKDGRHVLIDVNPCGDWFGFFNQATRNEIAQKISSIL